ncbi:hypothetical protein Bca101_011662 [Brassica carinata]
MTSCNRGQKDFVCQVEFVFDIEKANSPTPRRRSRGDRGRENRFQRPDLTPDRKPQPPYPTKETPHDAALYALLRDSEPKLTRCDTDIL